MDDFGDFRATPCWATSISHDSGNPNSSPRKGDSAADGLARRGAAGAAALWPGLVQMLSMWLLELLRVIWNWMGTNME